MRTFSRNQVGLFIRRHERAGTLWDGRYEARLVIGECADPLRTPHPEYLAPGADPRTRASAYRDPLAEVMPDELVKKIRGYLAQQRAVGTDRFRAWVEARTGRFARLRPVGRQLSG